MKHTTLPKQLIAPPHPHRIRLSRPQWIGLPLLALIPLLALFGLFGESMGHVEKQGRELAVSIDYPSRYRYKQINPVEVHLENRSGAVLDTVIVDFDPSWIDRFSTVTFIPAPTEAFRVEVTGLEPGERQVIWGEIQAEHYGRHSGTIDVYRKGSTDTVTLTLNTYVFP